MAAVATEAARVYGRSLSKTSPCAWAFRFGYAIFRREPASGTRSSIACSATSPRTGADLGFGNAVGAAEVEADDGGIAFALGHVGEDGIDFLLRQDRKTLW